MSPRATIIPSDNSNISSKLSIPSWFSILDMIFTLSPPFESNKFLNAITSDAFLTNDAAI